MNVKTLTVAVAALLVAVCGPRSAGAQAVSDVQVTLLDVPTVAYYIDSYSPLSANVGTTGSTNLNPAMNLVVGKRYKFTFADGANHPFQVIAEAANPTGDTILLSQGGIVGSFESDPGVAWLETGSDMYFTVTTALLTAMNAGGSVPGYRCDFHPASMRGLFLVSSGVKDWSQY